MWSTPSFTNEFVLLLMYISNSQFPPPPIVISCYQLLKFKVSKLSSKIKVSPEETEAIIADVAIVFESIINKIG
jgi:hypothetical protein